MGVLQIRATFHLTTRYACIQICYHLASEQPRLWIVVNHSQKLCDVGHVGLCWLSAVTPAKYHHYSTNNYCLRVALQHEPASASTCGRNFITNTTAAG